MLIRAADRKTGSLTPGYTLLSALSTGNLPDQLIDDCVGKIKEQNGFDLNHLFDAVRSKGRSLELTEDRFWQTGYGSDSIHLLLHIERRKGRRQVSEVLEIRRYDPGKDRYELGTLYRRNGEHHE